MDVSSFVVAFVCVLAFQTCVHAQRRPRLDLSDPCTVAIRKSYYQRWTKEVDPSCMNGSIYYSYPAGDVFLRFQQQTTSPFLVCLDMKPDNSGIRFYDVTEKYPALRTEIPFPGEGNLACIPDLNGVVDIQLDGPYFPRAYASVVHYQIMMDWAPEGTVV